MSERCLTAAEALKKKGNAAHKRGEFHLAAQLYGEAIHAAAGHSEILRLLHSNRSASFLAAGQASDAISEANLCIAADSSWAKGHYRLGKALEVIGLVQDALSAFKDALALMPEDAELSTAVSNCMAIVATKETVPAARCDDKASLPSGKADSRVRNPNYQKMAIAHAKVLIDAGDWQTLRETFCPIGYNLADGCEHAPEPEVLRMVVCSSQHLDYLASCIRDPLHELHHCALQIMFQCALWSAELTVCISKSESVVAAMAESLRLAPCLDRSWGTAEWDQWALLLRLCRKGKSSRLETSFCKYRLCDVIAAVLSELARHGDTFIPKYVSGRRLALWHIPLEIWACFASDRQSTAFSKVFVSDNFLSRRLGVTVCLILKELDSKGYSGLVDSSCVNSDFLLIMDGISHMVLGSILPPLVREQVQSNSLLAAYAKGEFRKAVIAKDSSTGEDIESSRWYEHEDISLPWSPHLLAKLRQFLSEKGSAWTHYMECPGRVQSSEQAQAHDVSAWPFNHEQGHCANCGMPPPKGHKLKSCQVCQAIKYCGKQCSHQHWHIHKMQCTGMSPSGISTNAQQIFKSSVKLEIGCTVQVQNLTCDTSFNDRLGTLAAFRIAGSDLAQVVLKGSRESLAISVDNLVVIKGPPFLGDHEAAPPIPDDDVWENIRTALAWAEKSGSSVKVRSVKGVGIVVQTSGTKDFERPDIKARIEFLQHCVHERALLSTKCSDNMVSKSAYLAYNRKNVSAPKGKSSFDWWDDGTPQKVQQQLSEHTFEVKADWTCRGTGFSDFRLFDHALGKLSAKKTRQRRQTRFKEWFTSGQCAACQFRNLETVPVFVMEDEVWKMCHAPQSVA